MTSKWTPPRQSFLSILLPARHPRNTLMRYWEVFRDDLNVDNHLKSRKHPKIINFQRLCPENGE